MKNNSCASTIFIGITNISYVWRLIEVLPVSASCLGSGYLLFTPHQALDSATEEMHNKYRSIFEINTKKLNADELQDTQLGTIACIPRLRSCHSQQPSIFFSYIDHLDNVEKSTTHIANAYTALINENSIHANHLRVIGKVISGTNDLQSCCSDLLMTLQKHSRHLAYTLSPKTIPWSAFFEATFPGSMLPTKQHI